MTAITAWEKINLVRSFDDGSISVSEKIILLVLTTHLGDQEFAWPSFSTLMRECCLNRTNLSNNINKLIKRGLIHKITPSDGYKSNRYQINLELITQKSLVPEQYQTSTGAVPDWYRSSTRLVPEQYPNRNIKEKENKVKKKRGARPVKRSLSKAQKQKAKEEIENYELCSTCRRPKLHCGCKNCKENWSPEVKEQWEKTMANLKGQ